MVSNRSTHTVSQLTPGLGTANSKSLDEFEGGSASGVAAHDAHDFVGSCGLEPDSKLGQDTTRSTSLRTFKPFPSHGIMMTKAVKNDRFLSWNTDF